MTTAASLLAVPWATRAQSPGKAPRIGWVSIGSPSRRPSAFAEGLRELGYIEGQNLVIERRYAEGQLERLPALVDEVIRTNPDVLVAGGTAVTRAMMKATATLPIVFTSSSDPVGYGLVAALARPGGNVTGMSRADGGEGFAAKLMQLLKQAVPKLSQIAVLHTHGAQVQARNAGELRAAAQVLKLKLDIFGAASDAAFDEATAAIVKSGGGGPRGLVVTGSPLFDSKRAKLIQLAAETRLPAIYYGDIFPDEGGLMSYGPNSRELNRRSASYVDKILKGAKPGDLPVQQAAQFDLVINLKTARTQGLEIPRSVLLAATRVIE